MSDQMPRHERTRVVRGMLVALGAAVVAYALSDDPFYGGTPGFGFEGIAITALGIALAACALLPVAWSKRVLLLVLSGGFTVAVAEIAVNAVLGPRYRAPYDYSERYMFRLRPGAWSEMIHLPVNGGHRVLHRINSQGYRGEELLPRGQAKRVVVYGDSFIHAFYTPDTETYAEQLERQLGRALGSSVEVVNAGTSSYGPDQNLLRIQDDIPKLAPDLIILAVFAGNDFGDLIRNKMFEVDAHGTLRRRPWVLADELRNRFELSDEQSILRLAGRRAMANMRTTRAAPTGAAVDTRSAAMDEWLAIAKAEYESYRHDDVVTEPSVDRYNADTSLLPNGEPARYTTRLMEAVLRRAAEVARARSVPFMLLFIPHPLDVLDDFEGARVDEARFPDYRPSNLTGSLENIAVHAGIDFVDLFETYRARQADGLYLQGGDDHWTPLGQKVAAEVTAKHILERGTLGERRNEKGTPSP